MNDLEMFNDIKDTTLRTTNRAKVMANIFEDNSEGDNISTKGAAMLFGYFKNVPAIEKAITFEAFKVNMTERGYNYGGNA